MRSYCLESMIGIENPQIGDYVQVARLLVRTGYHVPDIEGISGHIVDLEDPANSKHWIVVQPEDPDDGLIWVHPVELERVSEDAPLLGGDE